jgi:hypothetical protein
MPPARSTSAAGRGPTVRASPASVPGSTATSTKVCRSRWLDRSQTPSALAPASCDPKSVGSHYLTAVAPGSVVTELTTASPAAKWALSPASDSILDRNSYVISNGAYPALLLQPTDRTSGSPVMLGDADEARCLSRLGRFDELGTAALQAHQILRRLGVADAALASDIGGRENPTRQRMTSAPSPGSPPLAPGSPATALARRQSVHDTPTT